MIPIYKSLILLFFLLFISKGYAQDKNLSDPLDQRIDDLLNHMSQKEKIEQLYYNTDGNERLSIPQFTGSDGPHGIGNGDPGWSCFPVTIALAATWDLDLIRRVGKAISLEQASRGRHRIAGPTLDLLNDPRNGRAPETFGEDPFLGGRVSEAFILGQNETAVFGSIKHYNMNTFEANREENNYLIDKRSLFEFWSPHWKRAVQYGGAMSIMCAYNLVNGSKSAENYLLIKTALRDMWGFKFYTMCDWGGFWSTEKAIKSELDFCEGNDLYIKELPGLLDEGRLDVKYVNNAVRNILRTKIVSGMIDGQPKVAEGVRNSEKHKKLVYQSGLRSIVLLKNENQILPLSKDIKSVAVIGPNANNLPLDGHSSSAVIPPYQITVLEGMKNFIGEEKINYTQGCEINSNDKSDFENAKLIAANSDLVLFVAGIDSTIEGEGYFIGGDRINGTVDLPGVQNELINEISKINENFVLVIISGGPCAINKVEKNVAGIIYSFYPGQEGGKAITDVLFGNYNPSGKLPVTIPKNDEQLRPINMDFRTLTKDGIGYRWFDSKNIKPEYAFGFGLSYTTFRYANLSITPSDPTIEDEIDVSFDLTNSGGLSGEEVAQLYLSVDNGIDMAVKDLKGFDKIYLEPGESETISFKLTSEELYTYDSLSGSYLVLPGKYEIMVGGSSDNLPLRKAISVKYAGGKPDLIVRNIRSIPAFPKEGDQVTYIVSVLNRGTKVSPKSKHKIEFKIDGETVQFATSFQDQIEPGGMSTIAAGNGIGSQPWIAKNGTYSIEAVVDPEDYIPESNELNNNCEATISIPDGKVVQKLTYRNLFNKN
ncbi:MAG: glycoside hydrolase family 3 C-terminal domain-containing protein [Melioribacteraceae bacterium]|nr:glycoside hydrolase family 3 C-terminal domain-containing protein [Melioribacteraceae bacterium]MCF8265406.1 glycoside hydrolase family 3 C-terminal domain-containing protein [Melioribacteraceae bacterium]MCF8431565.1 glycoside hydrolase family 3 C-terminal domain-containing protein [Melioribacteraceae bacterium]